MSDQMFFLTPDDLPGGVNFVHPQMIRDLRTVASIESGCIEELAETLLAEDRFFSGDELGQLVAEHIPDQKQASAAASAIQNLRPGLVDTAISMINTWREVNASNRDRFTDEALASLRNNLSILIREYPAVTRMRKASRLRSILGNELERVELICDARPVFDEDRQRIEGLLALTTLKLLYERQNGMTDEIEIVLTSTQLDDLIAKAQKAQQKLRVMEQSFDQWIVDV